VLAGYTELLKNRNFVLYNLGQMISQYADRLLHIALVGIVASKFPGSDIRMAKIFFFTLLPAFLISPLAGVYVDRLNKKYVLIASDLLRSLLTVILPLFILTGTSMIPLYAIVFLVFSAACFFLPAKMAIIPELVKHDKLLMANSIATALWIIAGVTGVTVGAFMVEW